MIEEGMAYGNLHFPGTDYPVPDADNNHLVWND